MTDDEKEDRRWSVVQYLNRRMDEMDDHSIDQFERMGAQCIQRISSPQERAHDVIVFYGLLIRRNDAVKLSYDMQSLQSLNDAMQRNTIWDPDDPALTDMIVDYEEGYELLTHELPEEIFVQDHDTLSFPDEDAFANELVAFATKPRFTFTRELEDAE